VSFEVFVRPFVAPAIRPPAKPPVLPFQDTPEQGVAVLRGLGGKLIDLTFSETSSWSRSNSVEVERTVTRKRVYQKNPDKTVNRENFIDVEEATRMKERDGNGVVTERWFIPPSPSDNVEILEEDVLIRNPDVADVEEGIAGP
jgi:hypothetical protein